MRQNKLTSWIVSGGIMLLLSVSVGGYLLTKAPNENWPSFTTQNPSAESGLPPDPGAAGKASLVGIDSDHDGIRDDIQRYIALTYPNSMRVRKALTGFAKAEQDALLSNGDKAKALIAAKEIHRSIDCLWYIYGSATSFDASGNLTAVYLNTQDRSLADKAYNKVLNGEFFLSTPEAQRKASCDFDPDALPN